MTITVALDLEEQLREAAARRGEAPENYAIAVLQEAVEKEKARVAKAAVRQTERRTPAEILAEIAALSEPRGEVETASRDHDRILYGENGAR